MTRIIKVARGFEKADLVIKNANVINVLSEEVHKADIAICDGIIAGIGDNYSGEKERPVLLRNIFRYPMYRRCTEDRPCGLSSLYY